ncbi:MAG TPA: efflux RND transporter periplasmic adaptor subunit [Candidatus Ozemobacteraceae bacterium]|nr:efflux RND transporter periplasmic adaptor subunit [Candidatus Ozemobacteraceae bacterium]HQG28314.1 efflux RND transporter periplasmic adaptor subunit [Candidatus Ozemobacteraceae bacterium]
MKPDGMRIAFLALAAALVGLSGCADGERPVMKRPVPVTVGTVSDHEQAVSLRYSGTIEPGIVVPVAFRTGGYVKRIAEIVEPGGGPRFLQTGDRVASGAFLAQVEDREYRSRMSQAQAGVLEAQSGLVAAQAQASAAENTARQAQDDYQRAERLFANDTITRVDRDAARTRSRNADEALAAARASVEAFRAKIQATQAMVREIESVTSDTSVRSPLDGFVLSRNIEPGSLIGPGTVGFVVAQMDPLKLRFSIPDRLLDKVSVGMELEGRLDFRPEYPVRGNVTNVALSADPKTRLFDVEVTIPNPEGILKPGMIVQIGLPPDMGKGVGLIPLESIVPGPGDGETFAVFQVTASEGKTIARRREVKLGRPVGNLISVDSGVLPGEKIVISGAAFLEDGDQVHVVDESR